MTNSSGSSDWDGVFHRLREIMPWSSDDEESQTTLENKPTVESKSIVATLPHIPIPEHGSAVALPSGWLETFKFKENNVGVSCIPPSRRAGAVLQHCLICIQQLRGRCGGEELCIFKIGISSDFVKWRLPHYLEQNFTDAMIIHASMSLTQTEVLEAACINNYRNLCETRCRNKRDSGGEGTRYASGAPRSPPPYVLYVVAARADEAKRVGS
jgi:hypothetical protein